MPLHRGRQDLFPGIGDDTANVAIMLMIVKFILKTNEPERRCHVRCGFRRRVPWQSERPPADHGRLCGRIKEVLALDGTFTSMVAGAVGSMRYRVEVLTEGGHSYGHFGNRNAIHLLASMINTLYQMKVRQGGRTTCHCGTIEGGTSVNTIAQQVSMLYEFRSTAKRA